MSTIQTKDSYKKVDQFIQEGEKLIDNTFDYKVFKSYHDYLGQSQTLYIKIYNIIFKHI